MGKHTFKIANIDVSIRENLFTETENFNIDF